MATSKAFYVTCDKCGDPAEIATGGRKQARTYAHEQGYRRRRVEGRMSDLCPGCLNEESLRREDESEQVGESNGD